MLKHANRTVLSKFLIGGLSAIVIAACSTTEIETQTEPETYAEGPAIWVLKDKDTVIHLFGTAPVLEPGVDWQSETVMAAMTSADLIVLETDASPDAQAQVQALIPAIGIYTDGTKLSSKFSAEEQSELGAVSTSLGAPLQALDQLKPWLASVQLGVLAVSQGGFDLANTPAAAIASHAATNGTPVQSLESATHLMELMAGFPAAEQKSLLLHAARTLRDDPEQQARLAQLWLNGDVPAIGAILHDQRGAWSSEVIYQATLVDRNQDWVVQIDELMESETGRIFVAVGYGHVAGDDSLIGMLERAGHRVVRQ